MHVHYVYRGSAALACSSSNVSTSNNTYVVVYSVRATGKHQKLYRSVQTLLSCKKVILNKVTLAMHSQQCKCNNVHTYFWQHSVQTQLPVQAKKKKGSVLPWVEPLS
jgi:hypothetical protein